jgi:hypothetical protein
MFRLDLIYSFMGSFNSFTLVSFMRTLMSLRTRRSRRSRKNPRPVVVWWAVVEGKAMDVNGEGGEDGRGY